MLHSRCRRKVQLCPLLEKIPLCKLGSPTAWHAALVVTADPAPSGGTGCTTPAGKHRGKGPPSAAPDPSDMPDWSKIDPEHAPVAVWNDERAAHLSLRRQRRPAHTLQPSASTMTSAARSNLKPLRPSAFRRRAGTQEPGWRIYYIFDGHGFRYAVSNSSACSDFDFFCMHASIRDVARHTTCFLRHSTGSCFAKV